MDEIEDLKRAFGPMAKDYKDSQLRRLSLELDLMAEFLFDLYLLKANQQKTKKSDFDMPQSEPVV
jgi:hypothetical protein